MAGMKAFFERMKSFWDKTNVTQRVFIGGLAVSVIIAFFVMLFWLNRPNYVVMYSNLFPEDASRIVETLKKEKKRITN